MSAASRFDNIDCSVLEVLEHILEYIETKANT